MSTPTLVFDADDTLWDEQGVLQTFEHDVETLLDRLTGRPSQFRQRFIATEDGNISALGYGFSSYVFSAAEAIAANPEWYPHKAAVLPLVARLVASMQSAGPRVIDGVPQTLETLSQRAYRLVVLTRGIEIEQHAKIQRSGLANFFSEIRVVGHKDIETYRLTARELGDPDGEQLCMIGNSMRSDVAPALEAGWRAIHIPAPTEWEHDAAEAAATARFHRAGRFKEVADLVQAAGFWR